MLGANWSLCTWKKEENYLEGNIRYIGGFHVTNCTTYYV